MPGRWWCPARGRAKRVGGGSQNPDHLHLEGDGLPGERVAFERGQLLVDGRPLAEPYVKERAPWNEAELELGPDEYFLVGDNRGMAPRDHTHGAFQRERIVGKILW